MPGSTAISPQCDACGYDLTGLPREAPCPECGQALGALPPDAIAHQPAKTIRRVATGLALLAFMPLMMLAALALLLATAATTLGMSLANDSATTPQSVLSALSMLMLLFGVGAGVMAFGAFACWCYGLYEICAAPVRSDARGRAVTRLILRVAAPLCFLSYLGALIVQDAPDASPVRSTLIVAFAIGAYVSLPCTIIAGPLTLSDLARRTGQGTIRTRASRLFMLAVGWVLLATAVLAVAAVASSAMVPAAIFGAMMLILLLGAVHIVGSVAGVAAALLRETSRLYTESSGERHWSGRRFCPAAIRMSVALHRVKRRPPGPPRPSAREHPAPPAG